ncbi:MAG: CarD family transcriptional regulator [Nitriliruptoraceae bacterium]|jgi:CarD family transcriptional regulator
MAYSVGDTVVYPHHGAAIVESTEKRELHGEPCDYLVLRMTYGDLTLLVPASTCHEVGIRDVVSGEEVERVLDVLREEDAEKKGSWSRRFKSNFEKLRSGDIYQVAEVVRNLSTRDSDKGLSAGERRMLAKAKEILLSELSVALGKDEQQTDELIVQVLLDAHGVR